MAQRWGPCILSGNNLSSHCVTHPNQEDVFFEKNYFDKLARQNKTAYRHAKPFPHFVFDDFLPINLANRLADHFPKPNFANFRLNESSHQWKKQSSLQLTNFAGLIPAFRHTLNEFNGKVCTEFLEDLTGIEGLIGDPHFTGGGLHQILRGGRLAVHADFNWDAKRKLDRRLNLLLFLNRDWSNEWGGDLELWSRDMSRCEVRIAPLFNRCVIFNTNSWSYHGHPDALACPEPRTRNSIAIYYYSNGRPTEEKVEPHETLWQARRGEKFPNRFMTWLKRSCHLAAHFYTKLVRG